MPTRPPSASPPRVALTRSVPASLAACELTHLARAPIDVARAAAQHEAYEAALRALGCRVRRLPTADDLPDSVFVEDVAVVLDEVAVIARPGAESRRAERASVAPVISEYRELLAIAAPGTLDGGDVLRLGRMLYVGLSTRTNEDGARQLGRLVAPFGYRVRCVQTSGCLHLKSAVTALPGEAVLLNPEWVDARLFAPMAAVEVAPDEPHAANVLRIGDAVIAAAAHTRTIAGLRARGQDVTTVDVSELAKAEAGVTCCSLLLE
jgi:dimethylargininase